MLEPDLLAPDGHGPLDVLDDGVLAQADAFARPGGRDAELDFFLGPDGFVLNEVNTMPGMTAQSQVPRMFAADGLPYPELLDLLVTDVAAPSG